MKTTQQGSTHFHVMAKPIGPICNLDCEYCFYLEKEDLYPGTSSFKMSDDVLEEYVRQYIENQPSDAQVVDFTWQGGEPTLMGIDFFKQVLSFQEKYSRSGMKIQNSIQTNGTRLNDEWGKFLKNNSFLVGISIDGPEELHDSFRPDKRGNGSFRKVMDGLEILRKYEVEFNTLTCVQSENGDYPVRVYNFLKEIGSSFMQFIPVVEPQGDGVSYRSVKPDQYGDFLTGVFKEWLRQDDVGKIFVQDFDVTLTQVVGLPSPVCVNAETCGNAVALEHNGDVYSCDHFVSPEYHIGNIRDQEIDSMINGTFQQEFGQAKHDELPRYCHQCDYQSYCNGGCPKDRIKSTPDGEPNLNYLCEGYKKYYSSTIPVFEKMAECLRMGLPASEYKRLGQIKRGQIFNRRTPGRNDPCVCGSNRKYKHCCG